MVFKGKRMSKLAVIGHLVRENEKLYEEILKLTESYAFMAGQNDYRNKMMGSMKVPDEIRIDDLIDIGEELDNG